MTTQKKPFLTLVLIMITAPLLSQCASQSEIKNLHYKLRIVSNKVDSMKANTVNSIQKRQAFSSSQLDHVQEELLQTKSRVEELAHLIKMMQEQLKEHNVAIQSLGNSLRKQQENANAANIARIKEAERLAQEAKAAAEIAKARRKQAELAYSQKRQSSVGVETIRARKENKVIRYGSTPTKIIATSSQTQQRPGIDIGQIPSNDLLNQGQKAYNEGNFQKAHDIYKKFINQKASSPLTIDAYFMMGESLYQLKQYNPAIMEYQKVISSYPNDKKAATALFRQGNSFERLSDLETAKMIYKKLIGSHPKSAEAAKAQLLLNKL